MRSAHGTYLDWNATAPLRAEARDAIIAAWEVFGNPSSVHAEGRRARRLIEDAREEIAALVGAEPGEVVFTSGASEANTTIVMSGWTAIAVAGIEHDSVLEPVAASGAQKIALPVARSGLINSVALGAVSLVSGRTLVTVQLANNETGVVQPVGDIAAWAKAQGAATHTDATQAVGRVPLSFAALGVDYLSCSSHKIGGPKGVGALIVREGAPSMPLLLGGRQERNRRAGTENVAGIAGFAAAAKAACGELTDQARVARLRDRLEADVLAMTPNVEIIGSGAPRLPNTSLIALAGSNAEVLVAALDLAGVAVSAGAACSSGKVTQSRVVDAMGLSTEVAKSAIRVSLGPTTTADDVAAFTAAWSSITKVAARAA